VTLPLNYVPRAGLLDAPPGRIAEKTPTTLMVLHYPAGV
jgi:hypothetical protein